MEQIKVVQIGLGPLGQKIPKYIAEREGIQLVGAVDVNPSFQGLDLGTHCGLEPMNIAIKSSLAECLKTVKADAVILTTVSTMDKITPQVEEIVGFGLPIVSTCEELIYPWDTSPALAARIDTAAKNAKVAVLGTGVNPGYLMDALPAFLTAVCQQVESVRVSRFQNAAFRRIPFQKKIGAGLNLEEFESLKKKGTLRHVGLTESIHLIANTMGWKLSKTEDIITPVIAEKEIKTDAMVIPAGFAAGVQQIGRGWVEGNEKITLHFKAAVGEPESYDRVEIQGEPNIVSTIKDGVNGDIATCAIVLNALKQILKVSPGLRTMADMPLTAFFR
ncbi:dihydrodipicolinate reductase [bacterium]|nr:dihydrodipicolinate reductase [bacterium]